MVLGAKILPLLMDGQVEVPKLGGPMLACLEWDSGLRGPGELLFPDPWGLVTGPVTDGTRTFHTFSFSHRHLAAARRCDSLFASEFFHLLRKLRDFSSWDELGLVADGFHL